MTEKGRRAAVLDGRGLPGVHRGKLKLSLNEMWVVPGGVVMEVVALEK